ncbi:hypothetical protein NDU88_005324 [Pleurodeles waltl]|uniref:Uncharacterized protein n=1 Tax=Pleurodeles waltl TaxID=8319 RepID=A0AAV7RI68_PLEWA|nr:hypothetical protein NDU88_005324 [Pleurodeles waltl]
MAAGRDGRVEEPDLGKGRGSKAHMCRLTEGVVKATVGTAGAVLWIRAALELRRTRSAVGRFPLQGRSSGSSSGGRVSTSIVLALKQRAEEGAQGDGAEESRRSQVVR